MTWQPKRFRRARRLWCDVSAESVMYPFIMIIAFVAMMAIVITGVTQYIVAGDASADAYFNINSPYGLDEYTAIEADETDDRFFTSWDGIEGYNVTDDDVLNYVPYPTDSDPFKFWHVDEPEDIKYVHIIRDNQDYDPGSADLWTKYRDFIAVRRDTGSVLTSRWNNAAIPFSELTSNYEEGEVNASVTDFMLSKSQDTLFLRSEINGSANFTTALYDNDFSLHYGWAEFRLEEIDFWNAISMLFYNDIPDVDPMVNNMIHVFTIAVVTFVVFTMAVRMTPFLGGA